jgi:hypothetical protein
LLYKVFIGSGNDADIDLNGGITTHTVKLTFLQGPQQFYLHHQRHFTDFIQQQRTAVGLGKTTFFTAVSTGKGAFFVAE